MPSLDTLNNQLAKGAISRMAYLLERMRLAEKDADEIIARTPEAAMARAERQYDDQFSLRPRPRKPYYS